MTAAGLAAARAFVRQPGRRSVLFINHGAEERGLIGSRYHAANPVVPLAKTAINVNFDMILPLGVPESVVKHTLIVPWTNLGAIDEVFRAHKPQIAAVIVEPIAGDFAL